MRNRQIKQFYEFPKIYSAYLQFGFDKFESKCLRKEFEQDMEKLGLKSNEIDKLVKIRTGAYINKDKLSEYNLLIESMKKEFNEEIDKDINGNGFIRDMFIYAILSVGLNIKNILKFTGITKEEFEKKDNLKERIKISKARCNYWKNKRRGRRGTRVKVR